MRNCSSWYGTENIALYLHADCHVWLQAMKQDFLHIACKPGDAASTWKAQR